MATRVAVNESEVSDPKTATCSPTLTEALLGDLRPGSKYVVEPSTSTVTVLFSGVVMVKAPSPTVFTVPTAVGLAPSNGS